MTIHFPLVVIERQRDGIYTAPCCPYCSALVNDPDEHMRWHSAIGIGINNALNEALNPKRKL